MIEVVRAGTLTTVQDLGRPGYAHLGVGRCGAADRASLRLANRLVGNHESAACLEITLGGFLARFTTRATIAVTGAPCPVRVSGRTAHMNGPVELSADAELRIDTPERGVRSYLAVRGGIDVPPVFGSRSTDLLGGVGPEVIRPGNQLRTGTDTAGLPNVDLAPVPPIPTPITLPAVPGPRADWFTAAALDMLGSQPYQVTTHSNRIALRLSGPRLEHATTHELPTEGMLDGALQVPADGQPMLLLADHPVTGGYPVIAVVPEEALGLAAQARPGDTIRFQLQPG